MVRLPPGGRILPISIPASWRLQRARCLAAGSSSAIASTGPASSRLTPNLVRQRSNRRVLCRLGSSRGAEPLLLHRISYGVAAGTEGELRIDERTPQNVGRTIGCRAERRSHLRAREALLDG